MNRFYCVMGLAFLLSSSLYAFLPPDENGFSFSAGGGVIYQPVYDGSDNYDFQLLPMADLRYTYDNMQVYANIIDGLGVTYSDNSGALSFDASVRLGAPRSPDDDDFLKGSSKVKNPVYGTFSADWWMFSCFGLSSSVEYYPLILENNNSDKKELNGLLYTQTGKFSYHILTRLLISGNLNISFMNKDYASAYFGNESATEHIAAYDADGGLQSVGGGMSFLYLINEHIVPILFFDADYYLGDARDSPLTVSNMKWQVALMCVCRL